MLNDVMSNAGQTSIFPYSWKYGSFDEATKEDADLQMLLGFALTRAASGLSINATLTSQCFSAPCSADHTLADCWPR
jgi:hypothetical protein